MSLAEMADLNTILIVGDAAAALAQSTFLHYVSGGEYLFEHAVLIPVQTENCPAWCSIEFIPTYTTSTARNIWLGAGFAGADKWPLIIRGPVPLRGPGYFLISAESVTTNDRIQGTFSYRKVKDV